LRLAGTEWLLGKWLTRLLAQRLLPKRLLAEGLLAERLLPERLLPQGLLAKRRLAWLRAKRLLPERLLAKWGLLNLTAYRSSSAALDWRSAPGTHLTGLSQDRDEFPFVVLLTVVVNLDRSLVTFRRDADNSSDAKSRIRIEASGTGWLTALS
jgi:hypothetical protein